MSLWKKKWEDPNYEKGSKKEDIITSMKQKIKKIKKKRENPKHIPELEN